MVRAVLYTKDQQKLITGSADRTVKTWNVGNGQPMLTYTIGSSPVIALAASNDGKTLAAGLSDPPSVRLFDLFQPDATKAELQTIGGFGGPVASLAFLPDNQTVVAGSEDKTVKLFKLTPPGAFKTLAGHASQVYSVSWSPDGKKAVSGAADKSLRIWDIEKGSQERAVDKAHETVVYAVAWGPKGDVIASAGDDKVVKFWNPSDGKELRKATGHAAAIYCLAFRPPNAR